MKQGPINFIDEELTNAQFAKIGYPAFYILKNSENIVTKFIIFDLNGVRTDYNDVGNELDYVSGNANYRVEILSTNGNAFRNDNISTTLIAKVYYGGIDITSTVPQGNFTWKRVSDDNDADNAWNLLYANFHSNVLVIDSDDVQGRATFNCEVFIDND